MIAKIFAVFLLVFLPTTGWCDMYTWVEKNGVVGFADSLQKVPDEYRASAKRVEPTKPGPGGTGKPFQVVPSPPSGGYLGSPEESATYTDWQDRIREAQEQLTQLKSQREAAQKEYETFRGELFKRGLADPDADTKTRAKISELDQQITEKEHELNTTIPDEARKAGVPPGALSVP